MIARYRGKGRTQSTKVRRLWPPFRQRTPQRYRRTLLGAGRSGRVYRLDRRPTQDLPVTPPPIAHPPVTPPPITPAPIARKIFFGEAATNLVHYLCFGAPNPYMWNADAVACAYYRRKILATLVPVWFGDRLRVAEAWAMGWDDTSRSYFLDTEFVAGRPVALCHPFRPTDDEVGTQVNNIMRPLQRHLLASGFDGLLWQVGKGNPSALNNLLITESYRDSDDGQCRFAWIDLESGVPALFPLNPVELVRFYLPQALRRGRPMFDDVDIPRLQRYLEDRRSILTQALGAEAYALVVEQTHQLADHQRPWKTLGRTVASLRYQMQKGRLTPQEADAALAHPWRWYAEEGLRLTQLGLNVALVQGPQRLWSRLRQIAYGRLLKATWGVCVSHRYRLNLTRRYVAGRILAWEQRGQMEAAQAKTLRDRLHTEHSHGYLADFCVHLALKLPVKLIKATLLPLLFALGLINGWMLALGLAFGGMAVRQIYTLGRMVGAVVQGQPVPWVAVGVGFIPVLSTGAFPCELVYGARQGPQTPVAQFILYDSLTRIGALVPAWGGPDTLIEHWFNRLAQRLIYSLNRGL